MKIQCKNCLPKEGIEILDFSTSQKQQIRNWKENSSMYAVKGLMDEMGFSHRDAKYIVTGLD